MADINFPMFTGVIPISLLLLATGTVLRKAAIDRGVRIATGRYGCRYRGSRVERFWRGHSVSFIVYTRCRFFFKRTCAICLISYLEFVT